MLISKELRAYRLAEKVMKYSKAPLDYQEVLERAKDFVKHTNFFGWFCYFGDNDAAIVMADELSKKALNIQ